jgi:hypothetical protein
VANHDDIDRAIDAVRAIYTGVRRQPLEARTRRQLDAGETLILGLLAELGELREADAGADVDYVRTPVAGGHYSEPYEDGPPPTLVRTDNPRYFEVRNIRSELVGEYTIEDEFSGDIDALVEAYTGLRLEADDPDDEVPAPAVEGLDPADVEPVEPAAAMYAALAGEQPSTEGLDEQAPFTEQDFDRVKDQGSGDEETDPSFDAAVAWLAGFLGLEPEEVAATIHEGDEQRFSIVLPEGSVSERSAAFCEQVGALQQMAAAGEAEGGV